MRRIYLLLFLSALVSGCAHPIVISPDISSLKGNQIVEKSPKRLAYYFAEDIDKEVTTPGGGGDNVRYKPYQQLDAGIYKTFSDFFNNVSLLKNSSDRGRGDADYLAEISISTNSSSSSLLTWPPTLFGVNIEANFSDPKSGQKERILVSGEGRAEFSEFKGNFSLSAKRASEDALNKLTTALSNSNLLGSKPNSRTEGGNQQSRSKEDRLRDLKRLFDQGLIDLSVYNNRQRAILAEEK
jgi:hypothetical protein